MFDERSFIARANAIEQLEFDVLAGNADAADLKSRLEQVDAALFALLRDEIRSGRLRGPALLERIREFVPPMDSPDGRYDHLDTFMTELLLDRPLPMESAPREHEMVFYQRTPSRVVLEMIARASLSANDVFYDIGSGLGEVAVLVNLLTDATTKGAEYEPAYCEYAQQLVRDFRLTNIEFLNADARYIDFADATIAFLYTPFVGSMLRDVVDRLRSTTSLRWIFTYGPCTLDLATQPWPTHTGTEPLQDDRLAEFAVNP